MGLREYVDAFGRTTVSAREVLDSGTPEKRAAALTAMQADPSWVGVEQYLRSKYGERDRPRRAIALNRRRLYEGLGLDLAIETMESAFKDDRVRAMYKAFLPFSRVNYLRRRTRERSRLYSKAPKRSVDNETNDRYQELLKRTQHDAAMKFADETTDYQNDTFWLFRVRQTPRGREPRTDIVGPEAFFAVCDPKDATSLLAIGIDKSPLPMLMDDSMRDYRTRVRPHWVVWSDEESFEIDGSFAIIRESIQPNPFGRIPGVLVNNGYRDRQLLDPFSGEEAVALHLRLWLQETIKLKGMASKTRQAVFTGETGNSPAGQAQDDAVDMAVAEGVGVTTIERGIDVEQFIKAYDHSEERGAAADGIPPQQLRHAGATSGYEMDLRRIPLEEIREDRVPNFRRSEREFAEVQSIVTAIDMPELTFSTDGWHMDFAEIKRPTPEKEKWEVRQIKRKMGHSDPVVEAMEDNPDFDEEMAKEWVEARMFVQAEFEDERAKRNNTGDPLDDNQTPQENGAMGGPRNGHNEPPFFPPNTDTTAS